MATIEILGLNRPDLVAKPPAQEESSAWPSSGHAPLASLREFAHLLSSRPYAGMRRQFIADLRPRPSPLAGTPGGAKTTGRPRPHAAIAGEIDTIHIKDFRAVHDLTLRFPLGTTDRAGWVVLLGENAAGKSTVLQATALALMGEPVRPRIHARRSSCGRPASCAASAAKKPWTPRR